MGKAVLTALILILLLGLFFTVGNKFEVPHTAMVTYKEMEPRIYTVTYYEKEPYIAEECEPIYGHPDKLGEIICPEPEEGYMTMCYSILGYGDVIGENCTNVTKYKNVLTTRNVTIDREVEKNRSETLSITAFEEMGLDFLVLEKFPAISTTTTITTTTTTIPFLTSKPSCNAMAISWCVDCNNTDWTGEISASVDLMTCALKYFGPITRWTCDNTEMQDLCKRFGI